MTTRRPTLALAAIAVLLIVCHAARAADAEAIVGDLIVLPQSASITITHPRHPTSIVVSGRTSEGLSVDLTSQATFMSGDEKVAKVDLLGWVHPVGNGSTQVTVSAAGRTTTIQVSVKMPATAPPSFRHEVMPVLSKGGCNQGACHGYSLGKNGFKLSLRGAQPELDHLALTREFLGRRVNPYNPPASLVLLKALGDVPHKGGIRFERGSLSHELLLSWVAAGAPSDLEDPVHLENVEVFPKQVVLRPGQKHQLQFIAHYSDGSTRDVTKLGIFTVNTERVAQVDDVGLVTSRELGETAVVARFERMFAVSNFIVLEPNPSFQPTPVPEGNLIDTHVVRKLNDVRITPSGLCSDEVFLRRVFVDLIGIQPKPEEIVAFVADNDPQKRAKVVDELMKRDAFVDKWTLKWGDLLQNTRTRISTPAMFAFREWIRSAIASNMPLDQFAREVLTSTGGVYDDPASAFYAISEDTDDTLQRTTEVFCGVRMLCARCHPHPFENWTQADYYGLHSFFNQVAVKPDQRLPRGTQNARAVVLNLTAGYSFNPREQKNQPPRYLGGAEPTIEQGVDRRVVYANWLTSPDNSFFARCATNRIWSYFFHRGIIDPVDDMRKTNPPINADLLDALTADFVKHNFDMRHLMRTIVTSETYQRSEVANASNEHDNLNFSRMIPRRLPAESMLDCLVQATNVPESIGGSPGGFTATQSPDPTVKSDFLDLFGKPQRMSACECERDDGSNMLQALHFINGKSILARVSNGGCRVNQLAKDKLTDEQLIEQLYLWCLARKPTKDETDIGLGHFKSYGEKRTEAAQDLMWALLNSRDFTLLH